MILSDDFIAELKEKNNIEEIISQYVDIKRQGRNLMGVCPFHAERTPSFCVYPSSNSFYCFGCGAGGDVITFLRLVEHWDYIETVKYLCEKVGMNFEINDEQDAIHKQRLRLYKVNKEAARFYHNCLKSDIGKNARIYLKDRKIKFSTIVHFGLGFSPNNRYSLVKHLTNSGYSFDDLILSNLAFKSHNGKLYDRFFGRLMFPIIDVRGNVIAFGARTLSGQTPKYINTSDTPIFKKSSNLFALNFACKCKEENLILSEGYMDVIALHQAGFKNAVATLGTSLTNSQVKVISRYANEVLLSYDSDSPGQIASKRAIELLKSNGLKVKVISIPNFKDPDEFLRNNGDLAATRFENLVKESKTDLEYQLLNLKNKCNIDTSEGKINYLTKASELLANNATAIEREVYAILISSQINVRKSIILLQIDKYLRKKEKNLRLKQSKSAEKYITSYNDKVNLQKKDNLRASHAEESLISCIINSPDTVNTIISRVPDELFATDFNRRVYQCVKSIISENRVPDISLISSYGFSLEETGRITKLICTYDKSMSNKECIEEYIKTLQNEKNLKKFKEVESVSENEIQNYIKSLNKKDK